MFAALLGASLAVVKAWEQGTKNPSPMALRLLAEVGDDPARWAARVQNGAVSEVKVPKKPAFSKR